MTWLFYLNLAKFGELVVLQPTQKWLGVNYIFFRLKRTGGSSRMFSSQIHWRCSLNNLQNSYRDEQINHCQGTYSFRIREIVTVAQGTCRNKATIPWNL